MTKSHRAKKTPAALLSVGWNFKEEIYKIHVFGFVFVFFLVLYYYMRIESELNEKKNNSVIFWGCQTLHLLGLCIYHSEKNQYIFRNKSTTWYAVLTLIR